MEQLYDVHEAAEYLKLSRRTIHEWLRIGKLKGSKAGRAWRIKESDLEAILHQPGASSPVSAEPNPQQRKVALVARVQHLHAEGRSLQAIAHLLNNEGVPTLSGHGVWQKGTIGNLLQAERIK